MINFALVEISLYDCSTSPLPLLHVSMFQSPLKQGVLQVNLYLFSFATSAVESLSDDGCCTAEFLTRDSNPGTYFLTPGFSESGFSRFTVFVYFKQESHPVAYIRAELQHAGE
jgi:hypothetical protein